MPYIDDSDRHFVDPAIEGLAQVIRTDCGSDKVKFAGVLNYTLSRLLVLVLPEKRYWSMALAVGTVICALFEFYRRFVAPYEDATIKKNGDIKEYREAA